MDENMFDFMDDTSSKDVISELDQDQKETKVDTKKAEEELRKYLESSEQEEDNTPQSKRQRRNSDSELLEQLPHIDVHTLETVESCTHEVAVPIGQEYIPLELPSHEPSKTYPFVLDPFQKQAILCIDNNQSVLVSAHTSAGKTVVAEYAIAMCLRNKQRVIYTTPIKALSNQKYRDFCEEFKDVGLITGDVTINPNASCLIMTTEIVRSMLYRGSEITREVGWVIFDEIHYMRDKERGYVWEETIILLPPTVHFVFLSATIPNASQFAQWICFLHHQQCHVVYTDYRPVPLAHYLFPAGGEGIYMVVDEKGNYKQENFDKAMNALSNGAQQMRSGQNSKADSFSDIHKLLKMIQERSFAPVVIFSFSKKECETYAIQASKLDFNSSQEKTLVEDVFRNAIDVLSEEDQKLPQIESILPLLKKGIGIHHGGLLPILKETIEILFGEGLIKALFATETFAMGLNMPARTVMFTGLQKFDGRSQRYTTSGEYIQMSGRAGRRGKDDKGIVIIRVDESMNPNVGKSLLQGKADPIDSAFHLTYNMVLNLLRVEEINPEFIIERSFYQFQNFASIPIYQKKITSCQEAIDSIDIENESLVESYYEISKSVDELTEKKRDIMFRPSNIVPYLQPGRLVYIVNGQDHFGWGVLLSFQKKESKNFNGSTNIIVDVMLNISKDALAVQSTKDLKPPKPGDTCEPVVIPMFLKLVRDVAGVRVKLPNDLKPLEQRKIVMKMVEEAIKRVDAASLYLHPVTKMKIKDPNISSIMNKLDLYESRRQNHPLHDHPKKEMLIAKMQEKAKKKDELDDLRTNYKHAKSILQLDDLKARKRVLKRLGYATEQDVIERKGRVACELSAADELVLTELIFDGVFNELTPAEICALLSVFVCDEKSKECPNLTENLAKAFQNIQTIAKRIASVCNECRLETNEENYLSKFKPTLMGVVHDWCTGSSFLEVSKTTDIFEGSIIRAMRRLEELLREMIQASKAIGIDLENKFTEGIRLIKRDIVFAASLYL